MRVFGSFLLVLSLFFVLTGCPSSVPSPFEAVQKAREGTRIARESLEITKRMNDKLAYQQKISDLSKELLKISDEEIVKRDKASAGAKDAIDNLRAGFVFARTAYRKTLLQAKFSREQQKMAKKQMELTKELLKIALETEKLSEEAEETLKQSLKLAKESAGQFAPKPGGP